ncbi:MAG: diguanylate cyclase [Sulfurospirillaceae bacterium]|nr:diguanylate cyclase [Sulfurospirillaceae bacterium]MDD2826296.1 diguanylate cyclase [Sulfurospirillaceae bacterium]
MKFLWFLSLLLFTFSLYAGESRDEISLQLSWLNQFQSAGFYIAMHNGYYQEENLDVTIKELSHNTNIVDDVLSQKSTYGIGKSSLIIDKNNQKDIAVLLALFQSTPSVLITTNPKIKTLKDLGGKHVMITPDEASSAAIMAMLMSQGIFSNNITLQQHTFHIQDLIEQKTDAMACYISNEPFTLNAQHIPYTLFNPKDYGFDFYGDILFTSQNEIQSHPQRVKRFYNASKKGWEWAFSHIEESAKILYENYNTQHKSLEALIFEGEALKKLAFKEGIPFGTIEKQKFATIANIYRLSGLLKNDYSLEHFIDPLNLSKESVYIGVLANNGEDKAYQTWKESIEYLSEVLPRYHFIIEPLHFEKLIQNIKEKRIDFIITNPAIYIQLEHDYGISRIATLNNYYKNKHHRLYGSVILSRANDTSITNYASLRNKTLGAVNPSSLGGYILGIKTLKDNAVAINNFKKIIFLGTHNAVIQALLEGKIDVGIVRTGTLEKLIENKDLNRSTINIIGAKKYDNFLLEVSSELYPEWPLAKLKHTTETLSNAVLSALIKPHPDTNRTNHIDWNTPSDYSHITTILREMDIYPYKEKTFTLKELFSHYALAITLFCSFIIILIITLIHIKNLNKRLLQHTLEIENFNSTLEKEVEDRTHQLIMLNSKLNELANTDDLTKIDNRRHFIELATTYFYASKRNKTDLFILSLDIDFFKDVNDTYGHAIGDEVLKLFCKTTKEILRESDLFGRIGGEEFSICLQNTTLEGALTLAEKIRAKIEHTSYTKSAQEHIFVTVSIGLASLKPHDTDVYQIMERADQALYKSKGNGRNQVQVM